MDGIMALKYDKALESAIKFANKNNLSIEKLNQLDYMGGLSSEGNGLFYVQSDIEPSPKGLFNDMNTLPKQILIVSPSGTVSEGTAFETYFKR